jgi:NADH-quinone oxidoreductase subunit F
MTPLLPETPHASYAAYLKAAGSKLPSTAPEAALKEVERSGLRGRGGAGFPTGTKWRTIREHPCKTRSVVCNAAEGEPGTFKDRFLIRRNPYAVIEGLALAARVVGTSAIYIGIKRSFTREIARLFEALAEMKKAGALDGLEVKLVEGPEEYLFGEEKALLRVIEGEGPLPREAHAPPYERGLFAKPDSPNPALVNNAETFAHVAGILRKGADAFRRVGTADTPGTILATLSGDVARPGVYEVPAGLTVRELLYRVGDGPRDGRSFQAVLAGISAGVITPDKFETHCDFGSLRMIGSGLGSAGFIVIDDQTSLPRVAQAVARFLYVESCNQCTACKHGLRAASTALDELFDPKAGGPASLEKALYGARSAPQANRCYLPVQGSLILPNLMGRFKDAFDALAKRPGSRAAKWDLPTLVDFDEASRTFVSDARQPRKKPDWTYDEPRKTTARFIVSAPSPAPQGDLAVRLAPELRDALQLEADARGVDVDRLVEDALKEWLKSK